jgi:hypothetical protein
MTADCDGPSFLDLPAEIRNHIYAILFSREDELQLAEVADGGVALVRRSEDDDAAETKYFQQMKRGHFVPGPKMGPEPTLPRPRRVQQEGLHMLRACRQVHHEAAPILYSNAFLLHARRSCYYDRTGQYFNAASAAWLSQIGQCSDFIHKLIIDLGNIASLNCSCGGEEPPGTFRAQDRYISLGPLVNAIWSSSADITVSFVNSGPIPSICMCTPGQGSSNHSQDLFRNTHRLSQVVQQVVRDDLGMKQFRRAIRNIGISTKGPDGVFVFKTTDWQTRQNELYSNWRTNTNPFFENARFFEATSDGALRFCVDQAGKKPRTVLGFPSKVCHTILRYTLDSVESYDIDLDSPIDFKHLCGIIYVNSSLYRQSAALDEFLLYHTFNISMTAGASRNFDVGKLKCLLDLDMMDVVHSDQCNTEYTIFGLAVDFAFDLHVHSGLQATSSLNATRVNVMPLIAATFRARADRVITFHFHGDNGRVQRSTSSIQKLRQSVLLLLRKYVREDHAKDAGVLCPELWLDNQGTIDVVSTGSVVLGSRQDPAKEFTTLWSAWKTGYVGAEAPPIPEIGGLARSMYLYFEWITL